MVLWDQACVKAEKHVTAESLRTIRQILPLVLLESGLCSAYRKSTCQKEEKNILVTEFSLIIFSRLLSLPLDRSASSFKTIIYLLTVS